MEYVCGFCIAAHSQLVLLIKKNRPAFQAGKWNGIGGKLEPGETPLDAMVREFREECGVITAPEEWTHTITMTGNDDGANVGHSFKVYYFRMLCAQMPNYEQMTDEYVAAISYRNGLWDLPTLENMRWIFPLQLNRNVVFPLDVQWRH